MNKYIAFVALLCAVQAVQAAPSDKVDCSKVEEVLDDLGAAQGISSLNEKYKIGTTPEEQTKRCVEMSDAIKTLRKYNKECYSALTQQVLSAILRTRQEFNELRCKDPNSEEFKTALEAAKCAAQESVDKIREAEKKTIKSFQALLGVTISDEKLRIRRACCAVIDAKKYFLDATKDKCAKHEKTYADYVDSYTNEAMGLICPGADTLDCGKLEPMSIDNVALKSNFFLTPMVKLVKTLDH